MTTRSIAGSSMAANPGFATVDTPFGEVGLLEAYAPDIALLHAPIADRAGNLAFNAPRLEGVWGALAAKRGVIATVERVVDDIRPWSHLVAVPAHRVLAVTEAPMGAHPGGLFSRDTPVDPYGEDLDFWTEAGAISHAGGEAFDDWIRHWVLDPVDQADYVSRIDPERIAAAAPTGRARLVAGRRSCEPTRPRCADQRVGARRGVRRRLPRRPGPRPRRRTPFWRVPGSPTWRRGWRSRWLDDRARIACSPPSSACGDTSPRPPTPSCSTTGASPRPR